MSTNAARWCFRNERRLHLVPCADCLRERVHRAGVYAHARRPSRVARMAVWPDDDDDDDTVTSAPPAAYSGNANANDIIAVQEYARRKKLKHEQRHSHLVYMRECFFVNQLVTHQRLEEIITTQPGVEVSKDALVNIASLCFGAILSASARHYKGDALSKSKIMLSRQLGLPNNIEQNTASVKKVLAAINSGPDDRGAIGH
ncbi:hypothetical protein GGX14DRAFT_560644 [Mycena pura]|uniref:Uncharacterized protein n=1 Tax=Mycena pura TaxID=153505 RepID=A0AAD6VRE0_9AGAR|nr:hypothetical protein GGX14DRAFT_560644 [Mycena pura]